MVLTVMVQVREHGFHGLLHSAKLLEEEVRKLLAPLDILPRQARVLAALSHMQPVSQVELAETFDITPASMSTMTDRLLAAGFITRRTDPNARRRNVLELTEAGRAKLDAILAVWETVDELIQDAMGPDDAQALFRLTRELRDKLGGTAPGKPQG